MEKKLLSDLDPITKLVILPLFDIIKLLFKKIISHPYKAIKSLRQKRLLRIRKKKKEEKMIKEKGQ